MSKGDDDIMLFCDNATATFGSLVAVDHLKLSVNKGEVVGIGGPNGAGKTTLLDLISGLLPLSDGHISFRNQPISGLAPHKICHLGIARTFQLNAGFESLTAFENVLAATVFSRAGKRSRGLLYSKEDEQHTHELLEEFGLSEQADVLVENVPILDRKKLMIATALATGPELLLLDEPVGGLTPEEIDDFIAVVQGLRSRGLTIVFIEHVMRFLTTVATRAIIMHHGAIIFDGTPQGIAHDDAVTEVYLGSSAQTMREQAH